MLAGLSSVATSIAKSEMIRGGLIVRLMKLSLTAMHMC